jgi:hypothetical protein
MRYFRRRADLGYLALVALATQLVLSFGHTHAPRAPDANLALACRTFFTPAADQNCPPLKKHGDECAVCWTIAAAGTLVLPEPPALDLPSLEGDIWKAHVHRAPLPAIPTASFDARGPPLSIAA